MYKIYLDTSIISAYYDFGKPVRQIVTQKWFENDIANYGLYISTLVLEEINATKNSDLKEKMKSLIGKYEFSILEISEEILVLSDIYRKSVLPNEVNDCLHLAAATLNNLDCLVSFNFKHLVNINTIKIIHDINKDKNLSIIEILSPLMLGGEKYGNI